MRASHRATHQWGVQLQQQLCRPHMSCAAHFPADKEAAFSAGCCTVSWQGAGSQGVTAIGTLGQYV